MFSLKPPPSAARRPSPPGPERPRIDWRKYIWLVILFFFVTWMWQEGLRQVNVKNIPYSEFKQYLAEVH